MVTEKMVEYLSVNDGREELYNADALMNDGGENRQTAAEEVLTYLLIEVVGAPDDIPYSARRAGVLIEQRLKQNTTCKPLKVGPLAHALASELEHMGQTRPSGDILHDALSRVLPKVNAP